jgi:hypothetical protein
MYIDIEVAAVVQPGSVPWSHCHVFLGFGWGYCCNTNQ